MTRDGSDRLTDHFDTCSRNVTPASARQTAHVLYAPLSHDPEVSRHCASVLSDSELQRADRFAAEHDKALFKQRRAFRRFCAATAIGSSLPLSEILMEHTENGRPYLADAPDLRLSFSSCRLGMLGAWSSTHGIGVDIEVWTGKLNAVALARRFFSVAEAKAVALVEGAERLQMFYRFWTLKEAALKSIGEGLPFGLDTFEFELKPKLRVVHAPAEHGGSEKFDAHQIEGTGACASLLTRILV